MSHHIYTTPGFIISSKPHGEAGKYFLVFTRDLGMIGTTAQGVRLTQSKLRYHVQDYSYALFSLVRGKELWRMTGAHEMPNILEISGLENKKLYVRILTLLKRLLPGEEKNEKLFQVMDGLFTFLTTEIISESRELIEITTVLRILNCLGYIREETPFKSVFNSTIFDESILNEIKKHKTYAVKEINNALKESQL